MVSPLFDVYWRGLEQSNSAVQWTADRRRLDGGNTLIPIPVGWECKRAPTGHQKEEIPFGISAF